MAFKIQFTSLMGATSVDPALCRRGCLALREFRTALRRRLFEQRARSVQHCIMPCLSPCCEIRAAPPMSNTYGIGNRASGPCSLAPTISPLDGQIRVTFQDLLA